MPEARTGRLRRQIASRQMRRLLERTRFQSRHRPTLFEAFLDAIELYGPDTVMLDDVRRREQTFGFLLKAALALGRLASKLAAEGETVGVLLPNTGATVALLFGMFGARRIPAMLNYAAGAEGLKTACTAAEIRTVITSREFLEKARLTDKVARLTGVELIYLEDLRARFGLLDKLWLVGWALRRPRRVAKPARPDDAAIMLFTSGSEGMPKGVVLSHDSILANVEQIRAVIEFSNRDKFMTALPMFHSFGLTAGVLLPLVSGCRLFLYPSPLHFRMIPELTYDQDCTVLFGTPAFLGKYGLVANPYDFYKVRYVVAGAEKLTDEIRQLYHEKFGIRILEGYGATECSPVLSVNTPFACKSGTVGMLLPGIEHRLVPVEGIPEGGELHVRGPNLMLGYLRHTRPGVLEPPSSEVGEGWYDTGDVVEIDADGFVRITARLRRFVKVAGEMVSLEIAERIAKAASSKALSAATSRERPGRGEEIVLFTQDPALSKQHLVAAARELGLPKLAVARRVVHVDKLPLLGTGKCDYVKLKSMAGAL
ncbi:MAG: AMP-binding protein [bacterium]|nr:AMP-binding protein [bacterium]